MRERVTVLSLSVSYSVTQQKADHSLNDLSPFNAKFSFQHILSEKASYFWLYNGK